MNCYPHGQSLRLRRPSSRQIALRFPVRSFLAAALLAAFAAAFVPVRAFAQEAATPPAGEAPAAAPAAETPATDAPRLEDEDNTAERIVEIRVEGNRRVEKAAIIRTLRQKVGEPFDPLRTSDDLRALWSLNYFSDIQLLVQRLPKGVAYVVRVQERPAIREVKLQGNEELSKDDFKEAIDLKPFSILDLDAVRRNVKKIQEKYVEKGYFLAEVTHRIDKVPNAAEVDVVFVIREHSKVLVKEINFIGLRQVPADELKAVMATKEGGFLSFLTGEGTYREELFQRDLAILQAAYYDRGFINVKVDKPSISLSPDKRDIFITIKVEEGEPYRIGKLDFSGDLLFDKARFREQMVSAEGEMFNRGKLAQDIQRITDLYYDEGYAYSNVTPVTNIHPEERLIDLTFDLQKGKQVYIERIELVGNTKTRDKVIRREMRVYEGDLFSGSGLRRSKERVNALGFFETVEVTHKPGSDDTHVVVNVEVKEKATGTFQLGFGFSNIENFIFTAQISQNNFLGWGQTVAASAQLSGLRNLVQISYFDPYFLDTNFIFSANFFRQQAEYPDFIRSSLGGDATVGYHVFEDVMATLTYTREYVDVEPGRNTQNDIPLANRFRSGLTSSVRASVTWDRRDNRLFPSKGFVQFASVETAPNFLGGSFLFNRYTAYSRFYVPLPFGFVFKSNLNFGFVQQLDPNSPLPISELYYLGGINTIRGYFLRSISPTALVPTVSQPDAPVGRFATGGNKQFTSNLELEFPIFEKVGIRGVIFYDAGNTFAPDANFFEDRQYSLPLGLFHSVGFGFRWFSPIGPLRFEWGVPLTKRPEDQPLLFEFTIGNFF